MSAQPVSGDEPGIDDPAEILRVLPHQYHEQFRGEYVTAVEKARDPDGFHELAELLRLWRLRAVAYSEQDFGARFAHVKGGDTTDDVPVEQVMPGWRRR